MHDPGGVQDAGSASEQDDLTDLLAPADVQFHRAPSSAPVPRSPAPVAVPRRAHEAAAAPDLTLPPPGGAPHVGPPVADAPPVPAALPAPVTAPAVPPDAQDVVTFGRWFQPVAGGVLPRADPAEPVLAVVRAAPGSSVHAVTAGRVRRGPVTPTAGGLELAARDGTTLVLTAPPDTAWVRDDEDVAAGEVVGVLATGDGVTDVELRVLVIGADGAPRSAVDLLVGLPDPGELDLGPGLGTDPFALDLELAGRPAPRGAR